MITTNKTNFVVTDYAAPGIFISQKNVSAKSADIEIKAKLETTEKRFRMLYWRLLLLIRMVKQ